MEEPLPAGGSCLLGSINLAEFVDCTTTTINYQALTDTVHAAIRGLNAVLDEGQPLHPLDEQKESVSQWRQIGLGIMGLADMLIKLKIPYNSAKARNLCSDIADCIARTALIESNKLAIIFDSYPRFTLKTNDTPFFKAHADAFQTSGPVFLRNSQLLTIAPTGTLSTMLGISGGIEPIFANSYTRKTQSLHGRDEYYKVYTPIVEEYMTAHDITDEADLPEWFVTSADITPIDRVAMQSVWQKHIDASISSTVNLPHEATVEDVKSIYMNAWKQGLKGITVYRAGCKREGVLTTNESNPIAEANEIPTLPWGAIIEPDNDAVGKKRKLQTGCGSLHVMGFFDPYDGRLQEVYFAKGSTGGCANFMVGLSRMVSLSCRLGADIYTIKDQLDSCGVCPSYATRTATKRDTSKGSCCPMAIGNALLEMYKEMQDEINVDEEEDAKIDTVTETEESTSPCCPECGEPLVQEGGCIICKNCGWSKCN